MASSSDCPVPPPHCEAYRRIVEMAASGFRAGRVVFRIENPHPAIFGVGEAVYAVSWGLGPPGGFLYWRPSAKTRWSLYTSQ